MKKPLVAALVLIVISVLVLIFNRGEVEVDLVVTSVSVMKSLAFLACITMGVAIGVLLK